MEQQGGVQSLERAFGLLETLAAHPGGMNLMDLAQASGLHKSTVHRLLGSLIRLGYVRKMESRGQYRLSFKLLELSAPLTEGIDLLAIARPHLEALRDQTGETVHMVVRDGADIVYVYKAESLAGSFRMASRIGMRRGMYCTGAGKSLLAAMTEDQVRQVWEASHIQAHTGNTITALDILQLELHAIRQQGYAVDNEENELGVRCVATALAGHPGVEDDAAISISAPAVRMTEERIAELAAAMLAARERILSELR